MKKTLTEELERIHNLTYGKGIVQEQEFVDTLKKKISSLLGKDDDPKKADFVSSDVEDFFKTLNNASESGGLTQQSKGSMTYQKEVEAMQIGLILLGYQLPRFGVDGLFGPETASAVTKFNQDNQILSESSSQLRSTLQNLGYQEKNNEISSGGEISKEISDIVSGILKDFKEINPDVNVVVTAGNDDYHQNVGYTSKHSKGNAVDLVLKPYNSQTSSAFIGVLNKYKQKNNKFNFIDEYKNPSKGATGGHFHLEYGDNTKNVTVTKATPEMLKTLISLLKERGVKSEDLKKHIDKGVDITNITDQNYYKRLLEALGAPVSQENLKFLYAWRQAEGKAGKYNPFNTTHKMPGSTDFNSVGVKNYLTLEDGFTATIKTLKNGRYNCIVDGLINDIGAENIAKCESLKTWGTGEGVSRVIASYNRGGKYNVYNLA